jgi:glutamate racemase
VSDLVSPVSAPLTTALGVFDSGVGGLSVLRELRALLPHASIVYVADSAYVPYGTKPPALIRDRSMAIARFLVAKWHVRAVVVACNTATTHAVDLLRLNFPSVPFVGMEPAIKPAAAATRSRVVGVLATDATLDGERFASLMKRHAEGIEVLTESCPGLVEQVEAGDLSGPRTIDLLQSCTVKLVARGADTIVLGCTHYPFLRDTLQGLVGPSVTLIDTAGAVARQTERVLADGPDGSPTGSVGRVVFFTSGDPSVVRASLERLWDEPVLEVNRLEV